MIILLSGIALWWGAHFFKRALPDQRARLGEPGKGLIAVILVASIVLMVIGYRGMEFVPVYDTPPWTRHVNNLLMLIAVILFGAGSSKSSLRAALRHPMLLGMLFWAVAHLVANGDVAALILFGSMAAWAVAEMVVINRAEPAYVPWEGGSMSGTVRLLIISTVVYIVIGVVHTLLGYWPFP